MCACVNIMNAFVFSLNLKSTGSSFVFDKSNGKCKSPVRSLRKKRCWNVVEMSADSGNRTVFSASTDMELRLTRLDTSGRNLWNEYLSTQHEKILVACFENARVMKLNYSVHSEDEISKNKQFFSVEPNQLQFLNYSIRPIVSLGLFNEQNGSNDTKLFLESTDWSLEGTILRLLGPKSLDNVDINVNGTLSIDSHSSCLIGNVHLSIYLPFPKLLIPKYVNSFLGFYSYTSEFCIVL
mmetsp:Transcript_2571/g.4526  ORF Transcript_2571/g.4526 Transcript_2571/m.4526 type:complete len:238 (+) Transcript_2571:22-735(+)